jgi:hypothetical protein
MPVAIKTNSGGGSVTLDSGTGTIDTTLTLPNANGTVLYSDLTGNVAIASANISGNLAVTGTISMGSSFKRNRIINGDMKVAQRGTSFSNTAPGSLINHYTLDRWFAYRSAYANNTSVSRQTGFGGSQYCLRHGRTAGDTITGALLVGQIIESVNMADLQGQTVTLSFWARAGANYSGGSLSVAVVTGTTADEGATTFISGWAGISTAPISTTQAITSTATRYTFTGTVPSNALEMFFYLVWTPTGTAGAADYIEITGVQLEPGTKATPYEFVTYSEQLAQCQRYFQLVVPGDMTGAWGAFTATAQGVGTYSYKVTMRAIPTTSSPTWTLTNCGAPSITSSTVNALIYVGTASALGNASFQNPTNITASAEL